MSQGNDGKQRSGLRVSVLVELMDIRTHARSGRPLSDLLGSEHFEEMVAYIEGYLRCAWRSGCQDNEYIHFRDWLSDVKGEYPEGWKEHYVQVCGGDHEKAMMRLLGFIAEFLALRQPEPPAQPSLTPERYVSLLDDLMSFYPDVQRGRPLWFFFGAETLPTLATYIRGYLRCGERHGCSDTRWKSFRRWLAESHALEPETWVPRLLERCGGDHPAAMRRLLDLATLFVHEHEPPKPARA
ncbi:hypothetical protein [Archangium sp.]|uniref:hypothetical protein n=1 Tax=Archangium sp. TaxID=1872627 RepID=UPI002D42576F|nr:hypothetical protein [Archangium sp.]HYO59319.1 hypothetical protein [Archangium sp.]